MSVKIEDVVCTHDTESAILVRIGGEKVWIPQSQVDDDSEVYSRGDTGLLVISDWFAEKKGLG